MFDCQTIKSDLLSNSRSILQNWLPGGKFQGNEYIVCNPKRNDQNPGSFKINIHTGQWADFATGEKGSGFIDLYCYLHECESAEALRVLGSNQVIETRSNKVANNDNVTNKIRFAKKLLDQCEPILNSHAHDYLRSRGIEHVPSNIYFHPNLKHTKSQKTYPGLVSAFYDIEGTFKGIHRTYLDHQKPQKAEITPIRMMLGAPKSAFVKLLREDTPKTIIVCEGIETGLSIYQHPKFSVMCMLSASNLRSGILFKENKPSKVIIAVDNDKAGISAAFEAVHVLQKQNIQTSIAYPPHGNDFNDTLLYGGK